MLVEVALCLIVGVSDGDTLTARCGEPGSYSQEKIRLSAVDAPESRQAFGQRSKQSLSDQCFQQVATITPVASDRYGRTVANVTCRGLDAGLTQVNHGMAWFYPQYGKGRADLLTAERGARARKQGLWADLDTAAPPVAPWEWRQLQRSAKGR